MRLLDSILTKAQEIDATDCHLQLLKIQGSIKILYRRSRMLLHTETHEGLESQRLIEQIKFHCGYRSEKYSSFQDGVFHYQSTFIRVALSPHPCDYITLRLHHEKEKKSKKLFSHETNLFLEQWRKNFQLLLIAGGIHSGKTTHYYEILEQEAHQNRTAVSFEDPIEKNHSSFFQFTYHPEKALETASSLVRFDMDIVGLGELRRSQDWLALQFLSLSSIRTLATCHSSSLSDLKSKILLVLQEAPQIEQIIGGVLFLPGLGMPCEMYRYVDLV